MALEPCLTSDEDRLLTDHLDAFNLVYSLHTRSVGSDLCTLCCDHKHRVDITELAEVDQTNTLQSLLQQWPESLGNLLLTLVEFERELKYSSQFVCVHFFGLTQPSQALFTPLTPVLVPCHSGFNPTITQLTSCVPSFSAPL